MKRRKKRKIKGVESKNNLSQKERDDRRERRREEGGMRRRASASSSVFCPGCSFIVILSDHFQQHRFAAAPDTRSSISLSVSAASRSAAWLYVAVRGAARLCVALSGSARFCARRSTHAALVCAAGRVSEPPPQRKPALIGITPLRLLAQPAGGGFYWPMG